MRPVILFAAAVILSLLVSVVAAQTNATDQAALIAFWNSLTSKGTLNWNTTASTGICGQEGVLCTGGKVVELNTDNYGIIGTIATQLGLLTSMTYL